MQHETTPNDNQVELPELPEWNGEFMTESEFAEAAQAYALEAVRMNQPAGGEAVGYVHPVEFEEMKKEGGSIKLGDRSEAYGRTMPIYTAPPADALGAARVCKWWQQDEGYDTFSTGCGHEYTVNDCNDGNPNLPFCPYCAKRVEGHAWHLGDEPSPPLTAALRSAQVPEWRPIETAPRDGTQARMLLAWPSGIVEQGMYLKNETWEGFRPESLRPWPAGQPTHWMPLPEPPVST